jgi:hypothetical protein
MKTCIWGSGSIAPPLSTSYSQMMKLRIESRMWKYSAAASNLLIIQQVVCECIQICVRDESQFNALTSGAYTWGNRQLERSYKYRSNSQCIRRNGYFKFRNGLGGTHGNFMMAAIHTFTGMRMSRLALPYSMNHSGWSTKQAAQTSRLHPLDGYIIKEMSDK